MERLAIYVLVAIALVAGGFGVGWHEKGVHVAAGEVKQAHADLAAINASVTRQSADLTRKLDDEQGKSLALLIEQRRIRAAGVDIRLEISDAVFTPRVAGSCPDPAGSAEFERLYNAAAQGLPAAAAGPAATGRVHPPGL